MNFGFIRADSIPRQSLLCVEVSGTRIKQCK